MKALLILFFLLLSTDFSAQSDWRYKPYVIVNDTNFINVKHPVFIMDSTLYIRSKETGEVLTFPTRDINYISKRCFYQRLGQGRQNRLSNSIATNGYFTGSILLTGSIFLWIGIDDLIYFVSNPWAQSFYSRNLIAGFLFVIPAVLLIRSMILKKMRTRMIIESKGIKLAHSIPSSPVSDEHLSTWNG